MIFRQILPMLTLAITTQACSKERSIRVRPEIPLCNPGYMPVSGRVVSRNEGLSLGGWKPLDNFRVRFSTSRDLGIEESDLNYTELVEAAFSRFICIHRSDNERGAFEVYWYTDLTRKQLLGTTYTTNSPNSFRALDVPLSPTQAITFLNQNSLPRGNYFITRPVDPFNVGLFLYMDGTETLAEWRMRAREAKAHSTNVQPPPKSERDLTWETRIGVLLALFYFFIHRPAQVVNTQLEAVSKGADMQDTFQFKAWKSFARIILGVDLSRPHSSSHPVSGNDHLD